MCPACGNGSGASGDGISLVPNDPGYHYKCFSGKCGFYGDIIDLYGIYAGIEDPADKIKAVAEYYALKPDETNENEQNRINRGGVSPEEDYSSFILKAESQNDFKYLEGRGISKTTQQRFHIGRGRTNYLARDTRLELTEDQKRYQKQNTGKTTLFNIEALKEAPVVFVTEGEIDAMSFYEGGAHALALCSAVNQAPLLEAIRTNGERSLVLVLVLDGDQAGKTAQGKIGAKLDEIGCPYVSATLPEGVKDPNDYLMSDREGFRSWISIMEREASECLKNRIYDPGREYRAGDILDYFREIEERESVFEVSTGFYALDQRLNGGLHEGLYIIGAISSLGKTTFTLQLADQIAGSGQDVIFFSLEMSKFELIAKSISRHTFDLKRYDKTKDGRWMAKDTAGILNNREYKEYTSEEKETIRRAIDKYELQADKLYIYEGRYHGERLTVKHIREIVKEHIERTGKKPVIFIDYLQRRICINNNLINAVAL